MALAAPQYANVANYCRNGMYIGFTAIPNVHTATVTLEQFLTATQGQNNYIEVLSRGLPNGSGGSLGSATSTLQGITNCPQAFVWAGPLVPMDNSVTLPNMVAGAIDADLVAIGASFVSVLGGGAARPGIQGEHTIRMGWEFDFGNYAWGLGNNKTGHTNTNADIAAAMDHYIIKVRAGGYTGNFSLCGGTTVSAVYNLMTQTAQLTNLDLDIYNNTGITNQHNWEIIWTNDTLPRLNTHLAFVQSKGKLFGMPECGVEIIQSSQSGYAFHSGPTGTYWSKIHAYALANAQWMNYITPFNQEAPASGAATTADDQLFYYGNPAGTVPVAPGGVLDQVNLGSLRNSTGTGPWVATPSPYKSAELADYLSNMIAGTMQVPDAAAPPSKAGTTHSRVNNYRNVFA